MKKNKWMSGILFFPLLITGCWDRHELNEIGIVTATAIDINKQEYEVTFQIVNPSAVAPSTVGGAGGGSVTPVTTITTADETIASASRKTSDESSRRLFFSHNRIIILSEAVAKKGIATLVDFYLRDPQIRETASIIIMKKKASEALMYVPPLDKVSSNAIKGLLNFGERTLSDVWDVNLSELAGDLAGDPSVSVLPELELQGTPIENGSLENLKTTKQTNNFRLSGFAVFKKDKMVGKLDREESIGLSWIRGKINKGLIEFNACPSKNQRLRIAYKVTTASSKLSSEIKNGKLRMNINVEADGDIHESDCPTDLSDPQTIKHLEEKISEQIKLQMEKTLKKTQKTYRTDILTFAGTVHRQHPKLWRKLEPKWETEFPILPVTITVDAKIRRVGLINKPFPSLIK